MHEDTGALFHAYSLWAQLFLVLKLQEISQAVRTPHAPFTFLTNPFDFSFIIHIFLYKPPDLLLFAYFCRLHFTSLSLYVPTTHDLHSRPAGAILFSPSSYPTFIFLVFSVNHDFPLTNSPHLWYARSLQSFLTTTFCINISKSRSFSPSSPRSLGVACP